MYLLDGHYATIQVGISYLSSDVTAHDTRALVTTLTV